MATLFCTGQRFTTRHIHCRSFLIRSLKSSARNALVKEKLEGGVELPPTDEWGKKFPPNVPNKFRVSLSNPGTAATLAEAFVPTTAQDRVIIEAFPGPGQLTRALLNLPKHRIRKLIVLETLEPYLAYLKPLEEVDPRVKIIPIAGDVWDSYTALEHRGLLADIANIPWTESIHPQLQFITHLPTAISGEQFIAQLFRSIPDQQWLFKYGRVQLGFILSEYLWKRVHGTDPAMRCKLSVIADSVAQCREVIPYSEMQPFEGHFHPVAGRSAEKGSDNRRVGNPFQAIDVIPLEHQVIEKGLMETWDYCLRRLYVRKATALKGATSLLGPGAQSLVKKIADGGVNVDTVVRDLTVNDWSVIVKTFVEWPFAPEDLSIHEPLTLKRRYH